MRSLLVRARPLLGQLLDAGLFNVFGSSVLNKVISFLSGMVVVRLVPQAEYGVYSYAYNILNVLLLFNGMGAVSGVLQMCCEREFERRGSAVVSFGLRFGLVFDLALSVVIATVPAFVVLPLAGSGELLRMWFLLPVAALLCDIQMTVLRATFRAKEYAYGTNLNTIMIFLGSVAGAYLGGAVGLIVGRTAAYFINALIIRLVFFRHGVASSADGLPEGVRPRLTKSERLDFSRISTVSAISGGVAQLVYYIGVQMVGILLADPRTVALFQTAFAIPQALNFIPSSLVTFIYPYFARHKDEPDWVLKKYGLVMLAVSAMTAVIATLFIGAAPLVIGLLYGEAYLDAVPALRVLMVGWFFAASLRIVSQNLVVTQRKLAFGIWLSVISVTILIVLNYLLIPSFGIVGAAVSQGIVFFITGVANVVYFVRIVRRKRQEN